MTDIIFKHRDKWEYISDSDKSCRSIWFCGYNGKLYFGCDYAAHQWYISISIKFGKIESYISRIFSVGKHFREIKKLKYAEKFGILIKLDYDVTKSDAEKRKIIEEAVSSISH